MTMTRNLRPGDRVTNVLGTFTVAQVTPTGYRGIIGNRPILTVHYVETYPNGNPRANTAADTTEWTTQ